MKNVFHICMHILGGGAMAWIAASGPYGLVAVIAWAWLMREAAQRDPHDIIRPLLEMPSWSLQKHLEWVAPGLAAVLVIIIQALMK